MDEALDVIDSLLVHYPLAANLNLTYDELNEMHPKDIEHLAKKLEAARRQK